SPPPCAALLSPTPNSRPDRPPGTATAPRTCSLTVRTNCDETGHPPRLPPRRVPGLFDRDVLPDPVDRHLEPDRGMDRRQHLSAAGGRHPPRPAPLRDRQPAAHRPRRPGREVQPPLREAGSLTGRV